MDATALSNLSRAEIVSLAKANKIKANLSSKEIIRQLLLIFPKGVPWSDRCATEIQTPSTPISSVKVFAGRVKDAFKTIRRGSSKAESLSLGVQTEPASVEGSQGVQSGILKSPYSFAEEGRAATTNFLKPAQENTSEADDSPGTGQDLVPTAPASEAGPATPPAFLPSIEVTGDDEDADSSRDLAPANPEDVRRLIQDMAAVSAKSKLYTEKASAMFLQAQKLQKQAADLRAELVVEQSRRQRLEEYFNYWRATDTEWSFPAIWEGDITFAPVLCRLEDPDLKGTMIMEMEVSTSDDEELVREWHRQDEAFKSRRKVAKRNKAEQRGVDAEMISDEETASDEEDFYSPFVLRRKGDDTTTPDAQCYVYPHLEESIGIMFNPEEDVVVHHSKKRKLGDADDEGRHSPRARFERTSVVLPVIDKTNMTEEELIAAAEQRNRGIAEALGKTEFEENWALGSVNTVCGWRS
ncbi:hypothetical protein B0H19DRAFT_1246266 [Mycena capillaripes]|nr:hypothetical protein B0H19DRAFT_1246266 [Mycena capillaripes]